MDYKEKDRACQWERGIFNLIFFMLYFMEGPVIEDGPEENIKMQKRLWARTGLLMLSCILTSCAALLPPEPVMAPLQAIVVTASDWERIEGVLQGYERVNPDAPWERVIEKIPVVVGRKGMGWGIGLHPLPIPEGPVKNEGDEKAPAGIFRLSSGFGSAAAGDVSWIRLPYRQATPQLLCIDDIRSAYYNLVVDATRMKTDWQGHEKMLRPDDLYRFGIVVDHNMDPPVAGKGSCIFMHIWQGPLQGTAGCTAMALHHLQRLLLWLDPVAMPVLIQLPGFEYARWRLPWRLP
jgi:L,D-peptidoglycan transpeptidase YkuD (ErfK/YbiS/YcfS/YnhG family)